MELKHRLTDPVKEVLALADTQPLADKLFVLTKLALTTILGVTASTDTVCDMVGERERVGDTVEEAL